MSNLGHIAARTTASKIIDVLVNNAGTAKIMDFATFPEDVFRKHSELMLYAPVRFIQLCIPYFKENGWGSVVNMASMFGKQPGGLLSYDSIKRSMPWSSRYTIMAC